MDESVERPALGDVLRQRLAEARVARSGPESRRQRPSAYRCTECRDLGWIVETRDGRQYGRRCRCSAITAVQSGMYESGIPDRYRSCALDNFNAVTVDQFNALTIAREYVRKVDEHEGGLLFVGPVGAGKTHLAVGVGIACIRQGMDVHFFNCRELLQRLTGTLHRDERPALFERAREAHLLILDELGGQAINEYNHDVFMWLLEYRHDRKLRTLSTSSYPDALPDPADDTWSYHGTVTRTLADRIGIRARSLLMAMCQTVKVTGPDERYNMQPNVLR